MLETIIQAAKGKDLDRVGQAVGLTRKGSAVNYTALETDNEFRERILAHTHHPASGARKAADEVIAATSVDLEHNLKQVLPVGVAFHARIVVTFEDGTVRQFDAGDHAVLKAALPPPKPEPFPVVAMGKSIPPGTARIMTSDGKVIGEVKNIEFRMPCPTPERHLVPGEGVCESCDTRCDCGHLHSHHDRMDGWKCTGKRPLNPDKGDGLTEDCRCEGFIRTDPTKWKCPGQGQCHGSMAWCNACGDVKATCHTPTTCDTHRERFANKVVSQRKEEAEW